MLTPLVLSLVLCVQGTSAQPRVETVGALLADLSAATSAPVTADRDLAGLPVFVDPGSLGAREVLAALAVGLRASIVQTDNGQRITRTPQDERQRLQDARSRWKELLEGWLQQAQRHEAAAATFGSRAAQIAHYRRLLDEQTRLLRQNQDAPITVSVNPNELSPAGLLFRRIVGHIGIDQLCQVGPEERRIWSNQPEGTEMPCPSGDALLAQFNADQLAVNSAGAGAQRFLFEQLGGVHLRLEAYDAVGSLVALYAPPPFGISVAGPVLLSYGRLADSVRAAPDAWTPLEAAGLEFERYCGERAHHLLLVPEGLPTQVRYPDRSDPLDPTVGLGLRAMGAATGGRGFVAIPSDGLFSAAEGCIKEGKMNVEAFGRLVLDRAGFAEVEQDGVTILRPLDPFLAARQTADRYRLSEQMRVLASRPVIGASDIALAYAGVIPSEDSPIVYRLLEAMYWSHPHRASNALNAGSGPLALIGACLGEGERAPASSGIDGESEPFSAMINRGINNGWLHFQSSAHASPELLSAPSVAASSAFHPRLYIGADVVPVLAGLGVVSNVHRAPETTIYEPISRIGAKYGAMAATPWIHALSRDEVLERVRSYGRYDLGSDNRLNVSIYPFAGARALLTLDETEVVGTDLAFDDLPAEVQDAFIDAAMRASGPPSGIDPLGRTTTGPPVGSKIPP